MISTLEEALERIKELEETNKQLLSELECYRQRNYGGRKKHNEHGWKLTMTLQSSMKAA